MTLTAQLPYESTNTNERPVYPTSTVAATAGDDNENTKMISTKMTGHHSHSHAVYKDKVGGLHSLYSICSNILYHCTVHCIVQPGGTAFIVVVEF